MKIKLTIDSKRYSADLTNAKSIAITMLPNGEQPSHFGAPECTSKALEGDGFVGDTKRGGSCNVNQLTIIPHCNGTHTESIAHIVDDLIPVYSAIEQALFPSVLITVKPVQANDVKDVYVPNFDSSNHVITRALLEESLKDHSDGQLHGLVIRTRPNDERKKIKVYDVDNYPVYLTNDAMSYIVERGVRHLLVDFPSVDKMYDEGKLSNHRIYWNVEQGSTQLNAESDVRKTISEMVYVDEVIDDGFYLCNLQIPHIQTDAVPSNPELIPLTQE
ncbi:MAG: cyclase family protein [Kangiellaceae bacterium]|nr:cyclase family protein [Kangiellaceae bacterium]MCW9018400.1 cyclase family protein [Kangiellaceae bacterium]